ncbi:MAG: CoA ester lyase, partial [Proteobacteria bacterium]|nr:CoA ester lyase [Pseudomonadota bacterium]
MNGEPKMTGPFRTFLFAPGNHPRRRVKVFEVGADAVILDLEDAVPVAEKVETRGAVTDALKRPRDCPGYVRVNGYGTEFCYGDVLAVAGPWLDGIVLPMVETPAQLQSVDWLLAQIERDRGMAPGTIDLMPIIETGRGLDAVTEIAGAGTRTRRMSFGAADFTLDVGM